MKTLGILLLCLFWCGVVRAGAELGSDFSIQHFRWTDAFAAGGTIEVSNPYGDIRVRASEGETLEVVAIIQKLEQAQEDIDIQIHPHADSATVQVTHPSEAPSPPPPQSRRTYQGRVDMTLVVPSPALLTARTQHGAIEVRRFQGDLIVSTETGDMSLLTPGAVQAQTKTGNITAWLSGREWKKPLLFQSESGDVSVQFPAAANLAVRAKTSGTLVTDFPPDLAQTVERKEGEVFVSFGTGASSLTIESVTGTIQTRAIAADQPGGSPSASRPAVFRGNLGDLPKVPAWKPGDPIREIPKGSDRHSTARDHPGMKKSIP